jgi:hypothetical protein
VVAPHFVAGLIIAQLPTGGGAGWFCTEAAPILAWCKGHTAGWLRSEFQKMGWHATILPNRADPA